MASKGVEKVVVMRGIVFDRRLSSWLRLLHLALHFSCAFLADTRLAGALLLSMKLSMEKGMLTSGLPVIKSRKVTTSAGARGHSGGLGANQSTRFTIYLP